MTKDMIDKLSYFTKIPNNKLGSYFKNNSIQTFIEHPSSIKATKNQLNNLKDLIKFYSLYENLSHYQEYKFNNSIEAVTYLRNEFEHQFEKEQLAVMCLDKENKLLGCDIISTGTLTASFVTPRDIMKKAIQYDSDRLILAHNHPSGDPEPSKEDLIVTKRVENVATTLNKKIIDHIIIGRDNYISFREDGLLRADYEIKKTNNKQHLNIYNKTIKNHIELLNKFTKIPKMKLKNIFKHTTVPEFYNSPQSFLNNKEQIVKVDDLLRIKDQYTKEIKLDSLLNKPKFISDVQVIDYINANYPEDNINIVSYLNAKNEVIESQIIPENLTFNEETKYLLENAILYDSNSILLSSKTDKFDLKSNYERFEHLTSKFKQAGIVIIDNIEISKENTNSYLRNKKHFPEKYHEKKEKYVLDKTFNIDKLSKKAREAKHDHKNNNKINKSI